MREVILDPALTYCDINKATRRVVALITGVSEIPDWALPGRLIIESPGGVVVGDVYYNGGFRTPVAHSAPDFSNLDNLDKIIKALGLMFGTYCNQLKAGTYVQKSNADLKADFKTAYQSLP